jgi:hypothetical protein
MKNSTTVGIAVAPVAIFGSFFSLMTTSASANTEAVRPGVLTEFD